jgi:hypothetical protein
VRTRVGRRQFLERISALAKKSHPTFGINAILQPITAWHCFSSTSSTYAVAMTVTNRRNKNVYRPARDLVGGDSRKLLDALYSSTEGS